MYKTFIIISILGAVLAEEKKAKFPKKTWVKLLRNDNFDNVTHIGKQQLDKPWFIFFFAEWCPSCPRIIPIWESIEKQYNKVLYVGAVNGEKNMDIRDRFAIYKYPMTLYFSTNGRLYYFEDLYTEEKLKEFLDKELWKQQTSYDVPTEISYVRVYYNKFTSPVMIPIIIVVSFIVFVVIIIVQDKKYEFQKMQEAKKIKQYLVEREKEKSRKQGLDEVQGFVPEQKHSSDNQDSVKTQMYFTTDTEIEMAQIGD